MSTDGVSDMQVGGDGPAPAAVQAAAAISPAVMQAVNAVIEAADADTVVAATQALGALLESMESQAVGEEAKARVREDRASVGRMLSDAMTGAEGGLVQAPAAAGAPVHMALISEPVMQAFKAAMGAPDPGAAASAAVSLVALLETMEAQAVGEEAKARVRAQAAAVAGMLTRALRGQGGALATAGVTCDGCRAPIAPPYARCIECKDFDLCLTCADRSDIDWTLPTSGGGGFHRATHAMKAIHDGAGMAAELDEALPSIAAAFTAVAVAPGAHADPNAPIAFADYQRVAAPPGLR